ncbi:MAG: ribonuclease R [Microscillaceae bacterium]|nr:ribonuclease R [Microscillaceae bacterium]MDW8461983.1 ribonuclease R [Cytophagales bacterium]
MRKSKSTKKALQNISNKVLTSKTNTNTSKKNKKQISKKNISKSAEIPLRIQVENLFERAGRKSYSLKAIFKALNIQDKNQKMEVVNILETLLIADFIHLDKDGNFRSNANLQTFVGTIDFVNPRYAFLVCENLEEDIWIDVDDLNTALDGDKVRVLPKLKNKGKHREGEVIEIIERKRTQFVGKIDVSKRFAFVIPDHKKMFFDIFVPLDKMKGAKHGEKVLVKIIEWHTANTSPIGEVIEVLGKAGENETEMHAILSEYGLPYKFPEAVLAEAERIKGNITESEIKKRRDFRNVITFTIDPEDAKDFDDALSIQKLPNGNWEIGIHIADVTHYVKPQSALDQEAQKRATSVYLVDRVVPMLPERLSNFLCSLRPYEDKLTFSAVFEMNENAEVLSEWFGKTIICSNRRFSYEEVQQILETGVGDFAQELQTLNKLAKKMTEQRFKNGAINFETIEVKFKLDENASPVGVYLKERKDAHRLIEEFMLLANKKVAEFVYKKRKKETEATMVYRVHEPPQPEKLNTFAAFARKLGYQIHTEGKALARSINQMIESIQGLPEQNALQNLAIRTMAKARYTTEPMPHFGLAFEHYTHFTSPIRRYPDMMVHRLLEKYLQARPKIDPKTTYEDKCKHATDMERRAIEAERASVKYKQVEYMQKIGEEGKIYEGVVTGLSDWGIYVEIIETKCEGMIRLVDMPEAYEYNPERYQMIAKRSGKVITFGDRIKVSLKATNLEKRTLDFYYEG